MDTSKLDSWDREYARGGNRGPEWLPANAVSVNITSVAAFADAVEQEIHAHTKDGVLANRILGDLRASAFGLRNPSGPPTPFSEARYVGRRHTEVLGDAQRLVAKVLEGMVLLAQGARIVARAYRGTDAFATAKLETVQRAFGPGEVEVKVSLADLRTSRPELDPRTVSALTAVVGNPGNQPQGADHRRLLTDEDLKSPLVRSGIVPDPDPPADQSRRVSPHLGMM